MRNLIIFLLALLNYDGFNQEIIDRKIADDGTMVKIYSDGNMEIMFPEGKHIISAIITQDGNVKPTFREDSSSNEIDAEKVTSDGKQLMAPAMGILTVDLSQLDDSTREVFASARIHYFEYFSKGYQHRQKVFKWQLLSSKIIFITVLVLVFSGVIFAAIQFYNGIKNTELQTDPVTTFEAGKEGLKVSSPILGVIILVISLVFFYLYLVYVYPIEEIF